MAQDPNPFASPQAPIAPIRSERPFETEYPTEMRRVRTGLTLAYAAICGVILSMIGLFVGSAVFATQAAGPGGIILIFFFAGLVIISVILYIVGIAFCMAAPSDSGAKGLAIAALCLYLTAFVFTISASIVLGDAGATSTVVDQVGNLLGVGSFVCFALFLRKMALYIGREEAAKSALRSIVVGGVSIGMLLPVLFLEDLTPGFDPNPLLMIAAILGGLGMLVAFVMYANAISYLRKAIKV